MLKLFPSLVFKYRAWKLLKSALHTKPDTIEDFFIGYCRLYDGYKPKYFKYGDVKDFSISSMYANMESLMRYCIIPIISDLHRNQKLEHNILNKGVNIISAIDFLHMADVGKASPEELLENFNAKMLDLHDAYSRHKAYCIYNNMNATLSSNSRKLLPLVKMASEIILITLLTEGEDYGSIKRYTFGER